MSELVTILYTVHGDKINCTVGFVNGFSESLNRVPDLLPWQARELLQNGLPNLTVQFILSLSIEDFICDWSLIVCTGDSVVVCAREGEDALLHGVVRPNSDALSI